MCRRSTKNYSLSLDRETCAASDRIDERRIFHVIEMRMGNKALSRSEKGLKNSVLNSDSFIFNPHFKYMENPCIVIVYLPIYGLTIDPHNDLLPVGLMV